MNAARVKPAPIEVARAAWGEVPPDWIIALAEACGDATAVTVARRCGISTGTVSEVLRRKYGAALGGIEAKVRAALMRGRVPCPVLGDIEGDACLSHQAAPFQPGNPLRVQLYRACKTCVHAQRRNDNA